MTRLAHLAVPGVPFASMCGAPMDEVTRGGAAICGLCAAELRHPVPLPHRTDAPSCPACGMVGRHWAGCPETPT